MLYCYATNTKNNDNRTFSRKKEMKCFCFRYNLSPRIYVLVPGVMLRGGGAYERWGPLQSGRIIGTVTQFSDGIK